MKAFRDEGFTLLELMSVVLVIGILVAIAIPSYVNAAERAQIAVLEANAVTIADKVAEYVLDGRSVSYRKNGRGGEGYVSSALELDLENRLGNGHFENDQSLRNPVSGSGVVLNRRSANGRHFQPAIFITDGGAYRYERIRNNPRRLGGTLIVQFNTSLDTIDVFYMDPEGKKSATLIRRPVSDAVH